MSNENNWNPTSNNPYEQGPTGGKPPAKDISSGNPYVPPTNNPGVNPEYNQPYYQQPAKNTPSNPYGQTGGSSAPQQPQQPKKPLSKKAKTGIIVGVAAAVVVIIVAVVLIVLNSGTKINLADYYEIEVTGMNGNAKAQVVAKDDANYASLATKVKDTSKQMALASLLDSVEWELNKEEQISNGDKIEATATYNETLAKTAGVKLKGKTLKLEVSGLTDGRKVDPFEGIEVTFSGISPNGEAEVINNSSDDFVSEYVRFSIDNYDGLENGDTITVTAEYDSYTAEEEMVVITQDSKEFTVEGLDEYITGDMEVTDAQKEVINQEAKDSIDATLAADWDDVYNNFGDSIYSLQKVSTSDPVLVSQTLLNLKNLDDWGDTNKIINIYEVTIDATNTSSYSTTPAGPRTGYVAVIMTDVIIDGDGNVTVDTEDSWLSDVCAPTLEELKESLVTSEKQDYNVTEWM